MCQLVLTVIQTRSPTNGRFPALGEDAKLIGQNDRTAKPRPSQSVVDERLFAACQVPAACPLHLKFLCPRTQLQRPIRVSGSIPAVPAAASQGLVHSAYSPVRRWPCSSLKLVPFLSASTAAIDFSLQQS